MKQGREEKACAQQSAAEESRLAAWRLQQQAMLERDRRAGERWEAAVGVGSDWGGAVELNCSRHLARTSLAGWLEDSWNVEVPTAVFLRGIASGRSDVVMPCLLQVLLRLPAMQAWVEMHADHCTNSRGCALCWLKVVREAICSEVGRRNVSVKFLPEGVSSRDVQHL